jgi:hypothetical protein
MLYGWLSVTQLKDKPIPEIGVEAAREIICCTRSEMMKGPPLIGIARDIGVYYINTW